LTKAKKEKPMTSYLTNAWHMAGWSNEVGEQPLSRAVCGKRMLIFRKMADSLAAMEDRCPHRFAPLSLGTRDGDVWTCGYHGLRFGADGHCVGNPFSDRIPAGASVKTYPVAERNGIIWIWPGNPEAADENAIVDFPFLSDLPANRLLHGYTRMAANYEYGTDNLMDLSHIEFVHKGSFAGAGVIFAGTHEVIQDGETLHSNWWMPNVAAPPHTQGIYPPEMRTDHWLEMRWNAPATMRLIVGATPCDAPREQGVVVEQIHILTPESEHSTHYFWATSSAFPLDDPELAAQFQSLFAKAFDEEDKPIIEAAYANVGDGSFWEQKPVFLGIDAGGTRARRLLETMRAAE
jgi:phenylpropionate dioxygenase-like ring-hydroxylating dioxygenase large terminal subunit